MDKPTKILIVDDDDLVRGMYVNVFKRNGFEVEEAIDGVEGLDKTTKSMPDVIFTGIIMPRMDGFAMVEALKKNIATSSIPVIISSHMGREDDRKRATELGVADFITRDMCTPNEAVERVKTALHMVEYRLKFNFNELDAIKLAQDMHFNEKMQCNSCLGDAVLSLHLRDAQSHEFSAKFVCSKCGKEQD